MVGRYHQETRNRSVKRWLKTMENQNNTDAHAAPQGQVISAPESATSTPDSVVDDISAVLGDVDSPDAQVDEGGSAEFDDEGAGGDEGNPEGGDADGSQDDSQDDADLGDDDLPPAADGQNDDADEDGSDGEDDSDEDAIDGFTPEQQAIFNRAQAKLRKKYKDARAERDSLSAQVAALQKSAAELDGKTKQLLAEKVIPIDSQMPFGNIGDENELAKVEREAWDAYQWASSLENAEPQVDEDGNEYLAEVRLADGKTHRFTKAEVRKVKADADIAIRKNIPARKQFLASNRAFDERLTAAFPDLKDPASELSVKVNTAITKFPVLKAIAGYREAALSFVIGQQMLKRYGSKTVAVMKKLQTVAAKKQPVLNPPAKRKPAAPAVMASKNQPAKNLQVAPRKKQGGWQQATPYNVVEQIEDLL